MFLDALRVKIRWIFFFFFSPAQKDESESFPFLAASEPALEPTRLRSGGGEPAAGAAACAQKQMGAHVVPRCGAFMSISFDFCGFPSLSPSSLTDRDIFGSDLTAETKREDV